MPTLTEAIAAVTTFVADYQILIVAGVILSASAAMLARLTRVGR